MSDYIETPSVAVEFCPTCQPDRDTLAEILDARYCAAHTPQAGGTEDARARVAVQP